MALRAIGRALADGSGPCLEEKSAGGTGFASRAPPTKVRPVAAQRRQGDYELFVGFG
jgi:hypothetical protein